MRNGVAHGRVLKAVAKTWPAVVVNATEARAREHIEAGRFAQAATVLERAALRYGPEAVQRLLLAWCLYKAGRSEDAREWAARAVEAEPDDPDAHWVLANALFALDRKDEAAAAMRKAVEFAPDSGAYRMELAWIRFEERDFAETRALVEKALDLAPDDSWVQYAAGRIFDHHRRHRRARLHYERALELAPANAHARYGLASLHQARGRIGEGVRTVYETVPGPGGEDEHAENYESVLLRWSWRWYEWALRAAFALNVLDWIVPTPVRVGAAMAGLLVAVFAVQAARSFAALPAPCRRDLLAPGRRAHFAGAAARTLLVLGAIAAVLFAEPIAPQHLGVLVLTVLGYLDWYRRASRILA